MGVRSSFKGGVKDNGLILHYDAGKIDSYSKSGLVVNDLSESKTTGGLTSSTIRWSNSNGGIIIFDGTSTKINIGTPTNLQFTNTQPFTISVWFKWTEASSTVGNLVAYVTTPPSATGWYVGLDRSGAIGTNIAFFDFAASAGSFRGIYTANNSIIQNTWMNVVATNDSSNTVAGMKIYVNGTLSSTTNRGTASPATPNYTGIIAQIGARANDATYNFEGNISQVMIYNRELSAAEVLQNYTNFRSRISLRGVDSDADNFLKAAHIEDATQAMAVNNLVLDLKKFGLWSKMRAIYPVVGGNAWSHAVNLKTPGTYNLTFFGTWTHGSTGMTPSTTYANTSFNATLFTSNSNHMSVYVRTNQTSNGVPMGATDLNSFSQMNISTGAGFYYYSGGLSTELSSALADSKGFFLGTTRANNDRKIFRNGSQQQSLSTTINTSYPNLNIYIGARNFNNTADVATTQQLAFASFGDGLTDTEAANFYTIVQNYQTALGRQV